jgi:PiT family inorganic phosphate transporter
MLGVPVSTTHAAASSVTGAGIASGRGANVKVVGEMVIAWVVTVPATLVAAWVMYWLTQLPTAGAWVAVGSVVFVLGGAITYGMAHTITTGDVASETPQEPVLAQPPAPHPCLGGHGPVE